MGQTQDNHEELSTNVLVQRRILGRTTFILNWSPKYCFAFILETNTAKYLNIATVYESLQ